MTTTDITVQDARRDLLINGDAPLVFREYMKNYYTNIIAEWNQSYPNLSTQQLYNITVIVGDHLRYKVLGCEHYSVISYSPDKDYVLNDFKAHPCSSSSRNSGYCWYKTMCDNRVINDLSAIQDIVDRNN
jgi:hypothetical protein